MEDMLRYPDKYSVDTKEGDAIMEISELLSKVTLDIIGLWVTPFEADRWPRSGQTSAGR